MSATDRYDFNKLQTLFIAFRENFSSKINTIEDIYNNDHFSPYDSSSNQTFQFEFQELAKLQKLIKARTTKVGLLFSELYKIQSDKSIKCHIDKVGKALYQEYSELSNSFFFTLSMLKCMKKLQIGYEEVLEIKNKIGYPILIIQNLEQIILSLFISLNDLNDLFQKYINFNKNQEGDLKILNDNKLLLIGKIWNLNDSVVNLSTNWKKIYTDTLTDFGTRIIEDISEEIKLFKSNPEEFINQNDDDPFGINSDFSDEDADSDSLAKDETLTAEKSNEISRSIELFDKNLSIKLTLIKLLINTSKKFIKDITNKQLEKDGNLIYLNLNKLTRTTKTICKHLDTITIQVIEEQVCDVDELNKYIKNYKKELKIISNNNPNFDKFINTWDIKYAESN
ncbi:uncharacterized protein HGUI_02320 [Hanseniaspora guilliermondii]|uniref:Uncharacterized protein n=1 Tax=Hanseniaspora guilliermondii TaxID=56406 RepID=A0A1L0B127_9ASCO|nr:uncharacterized protein HGUI_02320 [Hanseniaspora guilliermondii]